MTIKPSISRMSYDWRSQYLQFDRVGEPGLSYEHHELPQLVRGVVHRNPVDCLLYRNRRGKLIGILYHYPEGGIMENGYVLEKPGAINILVKPECQRQGIATKLADEAARRWVIDVTVQEHTPEGAAFANAWLKEGTDS